MISIVIPALNESKILPRTLRHLRSQQGDYEIIVVDGGSTDGTLDVARKCPGVQVLSADAGRAAQMNAGAAEARGEWLLFLHADTRLPEGAIARLNAMEGDHGVQAGGFRHRFSENTWSLRIISWINNQRCRFTRVFYGDQAPFVRRALFLDLEGYPPEPMLEDVLFGERLVRVTRPVLLGQHATTDARRFRQQGVWRSFCRVFLILSCHKLGLPIPARRFFDAVR